MAIKGKKKQQDRGSQARRRPAAPPRPAVVSKRLPWYRTDRGRLVAGVVAAVVLGVAWWAIADARANSARVERRQSSIEDYTSRVRALLQTVRPAAEGMAQAHADAAQLRSLDERADAWIETLQTARAQTAAHVDSPAVTDANALYAEAVTLYTNAARTYRLVPEAGGSLQAQLLERAAAQRDQAGGLWLVATRVLDAERADVELAASGVGSPAGPALGGAPAVDSGG